ncbi:MAG: DUF6282 family protein [Dehalococcoidia bacterium]
MTVESLDQLPDRARALLRGATDIHVHSSPDPYTERRMDARTVVAQAREAGMAGVVLKSHEYPTQPLAWALASEQDGGGAAHVRIYGGLSLDHALGGLNPEAVTVSMRMGATVMWMPTFDAAHWRTYRPEHFHSDGDPITVLDADGNLLPVCHDILDVLAEHDAVLASGHLSTEETVVLVTEARRRGVRTVITHAAFWIPVEVQSELAALDAYVEQCGGPTLHAGASDDVAARILEQVRAVGPEHVILSTDLGQAANPDPALGFGLWIERCLAGGFDDADVARMVQENPAALLGA